MSSYTVSRLMKSNVFLVVYHRFLVPHHRLLVMDHINQSYHIRVIQLSWRNNFVDDKNRSTQNRPVYSKKTCTGHRREPRLLIAERKPNSKWNTSLHTRKNDAKATQNTIRDYNRIRTDRDSILQRHTKQNDRSVPSSSRKRKTQHNDRKRRICNDKRKHHDNLISTSWATTSTLLPRDRFVSRQWMIIVKNTFRRSSSKSSPASRDDIVSHREGKLNFPTP